MSAKATSRGWGGHVLAILAPFAAILVTAIALSACKPEETPPPPPRTARVIEAVPAPLLLAAEGSGTIASRTTTSVGFLVSGRLDTRDVDVGDTVTAGQTLAAIDPTDLQNQLDSAKSQVDAANAAVAQTTAEEAAKRQLLKEGFTTQSEYNQALKALQTAQADLASAQASLRLAQDQLGYATLKSPVVGAVTRTGADPGQVVQAGQMIVEIADIVALDAVFSVPQRIANLAKIGAQVTVWLQSNPDIKVTGSVRQIAPNADPTTGTYTIKVGARQAAARDAARRAGPRPCRAGRSRCLRPASDGAGTDRRQAASLGRRADNAVHLRPVTVARYDSTGVMISEGLQRGDLVVIAGVNSLAEGQVVKPEKVTPEPQKAAAP